MRTPQKIAPSFPFHFTSVEMNEFITRRWSGITQSHCLFGSATMLCLNFFLYLEFINSVHINLLNTIIWRLASPGKHHFRCLYPPPATRSVETSREVPIIAKCRLISQTFRFLQTCMLLQHPCKGLLLCSVRHGCRTQPCKYYRVSSKTSYNIYIHTYVCMGSEDSHANATECVQELP